MLKYYSIWCFKILWEIKMLALNLTKIDNMELKGFNIRKPKRINTILKSSITNDRKIFLLIRIAKDWYENTNAHHIITAYTNSYNDFNEINGHQFSKELSRTLKNTGLPSFVVVKNRIYEIK